MKNGKKNLHTLLLSHTARWKEDSDGSKTRIRVSTKYKALGMKGRGNKTVRDLGENRVHTHRWKHEEKRRCHNPEEVRQKLLQQGWEDAEGGTNRSEYKEFLTSSKRSIPLLKGKGWKKREGTNSRP